MKIRHSYKILFSNSFFITLFAVLIVAINCRGYRFMLPEAFHHVHMNVAKIYSILAVVFFACNLKWMEKKNFYLALYLLGLICAFFIPQFLYTTIVYGQTVSDYYNMADQFLMLFWTVPLFYLFVKENNVRVFLKYITLVIIIGYLLLDVNVFLKNTFNFSFFSLKGDSWQFRDGIVRVVDCSSFAVLVVAFIAADILAKGKINYKHIFAIVVIGIVYLYVERTRMNILATAFMIYSMFLFSRRKSVSKKILVIASVLGGLALFAFGFIDKIIASFSVVNNGNSTLFRLNEIEFYFSQFFENKILGMGLLTKNNIISIFDIKYWENHNYEDIGIIGILGVLGISGVIFLFIMPVVRMFYILIKLAPDSETVSNAELMMLFGILVYIVITCFTLLVINYPRIPLMPFVIAIFEYYYYKHKTNIKKVELCC